MDIRKENSGLLFIKGRQTNEAPYWFLIKKH